MEKGMEREEIEIDLRQLFSAIWRRKLIIILVGIIGAFLGLMFTKFIITPNYESVTKIYIMNKQDGNQTTYNDLQTSSILTKDFLVLVVSRPVLERVISELGLSYKVDELAENIEVTSETDTRILSIIVKDEDPFMAKQIADSVREVSREQIMQVMDIEAVNIVEDGSLPEEAVNTNYRLNIIIGALLLIIITAGVIILRSILDDTIKTPDDIEKYLGTSVLGTIPQPQSKSAKLNKAAKHSNDKIREGGKYVKR